MIIKGGVIKGKTKKDFEMAIRWKEFELAVAKFFGCRRTGPMQEKDASDINHHILHVQCKHSVKHAIVNVWDAAKKVADKNNKIPVVAVKQKGRHGFWLLIHSSDLTAVANQRTFVKREGKE